jgi:hypothetical protein
MLIGGWPYRNEIGAWWGAPLSRAFELFEYPSTIGRRF